MSNLSNMFKSYEELNAKISKKVNSSNSEYDNSENMIDIVINDLEDLSRFNIEFNNKKIMINNEHYSFYLLKLIFDRYNTEKIKEIFSNDFSFRFISNINGKVEILCPLIDSNVFEKLITKQDEIYNTNLKEKYYESKRR